MLYSSRDQLEVSDSRLAADRSKTRGERTSILSREEYNPTGGDTVSYSGNITGLNADAPYHVKVELFDSKGNSKGSVKYAIIADSNGKGTFDSTQADANKVMQTITAYTPVGGKDIGKMNFQCYGPGNSTSTTSVGNSVLNNIEVSP